MSAPSEESAGEELWEFRSSGRGAIVGEPLVVGGSVFFTRADVVYQLDRESGRLLWSKPFVPRRGLARAINPDHEDGDLYLINETVHVFVHPDRLVAEARAAGLVVATLFRDQRAYDRKGRQVRGYAILTTPQ